MLGKLTNRGGEKERERERERSIHWIIPSNVCDGHGWGRLKSGPESQELLPDLLCCCRSPALGPASAAFPGMC